MPNRTGSQMSRTRIHTGRVAFLLALALVGSACTGASLETSPDDGLAAGEVVDPAGEQPGTTDPTTPGGGLATPGTGSGTGTGTGGTGTGAGAGGTVNSGGDGTGTGGTGTGGGGSTATPFKSTLFTPEEAITGITDTEIRMCAHAALTYGPAFNTSEADLNVYWDSINDKGGVFGRQVHMFYENDDYKPETAVQAATTCKTKHDPFVQIGGIGFDQIPAVRDWAERNHMLYLHHVATINDLQGKPGKYRYSYTFLPTVEKMGAMFAELAATRFKGKTVGIIKRQSANWEPGVNGFKALASKLGIDIVLDRAVPQNQGSYRQDIADLDSANADVVWLWLNALETTEFILQAKAQSLPASFMVFPFNLETQKLGEYSMNPKLVGVAAWQAYSFGDYAGSFKSYAEDMKQFERQYLEKRPLADIKGLGGDLLFLNWAGQKAIHQVLLACGRTCNRNRFVETMHGFKRKVQPSACVMDLTRPGAGNDRRGGYAVSVMEAYRAPDGTYNFRNTDTCVEHLL